MSQLLIRRVLQYVLVLAGVLTFVFFATFVLGDPARAMLPPETPYPEYLRFRHAMGFDQPIIIQYARFASGAIRGDFGASWWQRTPALPIAMHFLPATLLLAAFSSVVAVAFALPLGIVASLRPGSLVDRTVTIAGLFGLSVPPIVLGLVLVIVVSAQLGWLPTSGYGSWQNVILPGLTLAATALARIALITRAAMIEESAKYYVITANSKGLQRRTVLTRHVLRNAAIPVVTSAGWELALMVAGYTIIVETIFGWPGIGLLLYNAIQNHDEPLLEAVVFVIASVVVAVNFVVDVVYSVVDPRVQYR